MNEKNKKLIRWINDCPVVEIISVILVVLFLTIAIINVLMNGKFIDEKFIDSFIDNVIKAL
jgi:hypothetical protein